MLALSRREGCSGFDLAGACRLHNGLVLVVKRDDGEILEMGWLRAVAERKGRFKIQSVRD